MTATAYWFRSCLPPPLSLAALTRSSRHAPDFEGNKTINLDFVDESFILQHRHGKPPYAVDFERHT
jgi:hypothetical protein